MEPNPYDPPRESAFPVTLATAASNRVRLSTLLIVLALLALFFTAATGVAAQARRAVQRASCQNGLRQQPGSDCRAEPASSVNLGPQRLVRHSLP